MNLIKRTIDIQEKLKILKIDVQRQWMSCPLVISHILAELNAERATYSTLHNHFYLNGLCKSAQTFTVGFVKLLSTHPIHIVVWGNFPFKFRPTPCLIFYSCNKLAKIYYAELHMFTNVLL